MKKKKDDKPSPVIAQNRKARHDYFIEEKFEAGLTLTGWEVKSLRAGRAQLKEGYVVIEHGAAWLGGTHISPLPQASTHVDTNPVRKRKLLLHRKELNNLVGAVERKGYTLVPLELYWKHGRAKLAIGLARGKQAHDKRQTIRDREIDREISRTLKSR